MERIEIEKFLEDRALYLKDILADIITLKILEIAAKDGTQSEAAEQVRDMISYGSVCRRLALYKKIGLVKSAVDKSTGKNRLHLNKERFKEIYGIEVDMILPVSISAPRERWSLPPNILG